MEQRAELWRLALEVVGFLRLGDSFGEVASLGGLLRRVHRIGKSLVLDLERRSGACLSLIPGDQTCRHKRGEADRDRGTERACRVPKHWFPLSFGSGHEGPDR